MPKVIEISQRRRFVARQVCATHSPSTAQTVAYYRRLLLEMRMRPASQREFLRKFLLRAVANGALFGFPVAAPVVLTP